MAWIKMACCDTIQCMGKKIPLIDRLMSKIELVDDCWIWKSSINWGGYGIFTYREGDKQKSMMAHRAVYKTLVGEIPKGLTMDHRCDNKSCVNPMHFEFETLGFNLLRGNSFSAINARKTHCPYGHEYRIEQSKYFKSIKQRRCHICHALSEKRRRIALSHG